MNIVNINQTLLSQHISTGPILAGSNDSLKLTIENGNKVAYYKKSNSGAKKWCSIIYSW